MQMPPELRESDPFLATYLSRWNHTNKRSRTLGGLHSTEPKAGRIGPTRTPRGQQQPLPKRGRGGRGGTTARSKKPKTAEELDNELDAFMDDADTPQPGEAVTTAAEAAATTGDVEMA